MSCLFRTTPVALTHAKAIDKQALSIFAENASIIADGAAGGFRRCCIWLRELCRHWQRTLYIRKANGAGVGNNADIALAPELARSFTDDTFDTTPVIGSVRPAVGQIL